MYIRINRYGRSMVTAFAAIAGWCGAWACEDVAIVSTDARYIVLNGDTLEISDVGDLRWLGIRGVDYVIPGSTLARAAFWTGARFDLDSGMWLGEEWVLVSLQDLGRQLHSYSDLALSISSSEFNEDRWVNDDPENRLLRIHKDGDGYLYTLAGTDLSQERQWRSPMDGRHGSGFSCMANNRLFIGGLENRLTPEGDNELVVETIAGSAPSEIPRLVGTVSLGCLVLVLPFSDTERSPTEVVTSRLVDLSTNDVVTEFRYTAGTGGRMLLFADGEQVLRQDITTTPAGEVGHYIGYTGRMRVYDTRTSEILGEARLEGSGEMSRLFCRNQAERVVLSDSGMIHVLDLSSLQMVATQPVPFERYFVF